ncbi:DNA-directed RNA polymerase subunit beta [Alkalibacillus silvisoli]|uniref:DNA-directed RNA polymerase subunit beta n=1 Tax=Alkalibacillus silvisoli TaxID=392823 RepID=A0ABP3K353_9BACI
MASEENQNQKSRKIRGTKMFKPKENNKEEKNQSKRKAAKAARKKEKKQKKGRIRYLPVWLRFILVVVLSVVALIVGTMIGFGVIGEGNEPSEVFDRSMWQDLYDYIQGK